MEEQGPLSKEHFRPARRVELQPKNTTSSTVTEEALKRQRKQITDVIKMLNAFAIKKTYAASLSKFLKTLLQTEEVMDEAVLDGLLRVSQIKVSTDAEPDVLLDEVLHILPRLEARQAREILNLLYKEKWFSGEIAASDIVANTSKDPVTAETLAQSLQRQDISSQELILAILQQKGVLTPTEISQLMTKIVQERDQAKSEAIHNRDLEKQYAKGSKLANVLRYTLEHKMLAKNSPISYLGLQTTFIQTLLRELMSKPQDIEMLSKALNVPLWDILPWMAGETIPSEQLQDRLWELYQSRDRSSQTSSTEDHIQLALFEEPLTLSTLTTTLTALTELTIKYWLIAQGRFADLIEYGQTHSERFAREAGVTVGHVTHNSPFNIDIRLSAPDVASALTTTIDGVSQTRKRLALKELEVQAQALQVKQAESQAEHQQQMDALAREQQRLALEQQRLEVLEKRLSLQKKAVEDALEIAGKAVDTLRPGLDPDARAMAIQEVLPNILQLQSIAGLELIPLLPGSTDKKASDGEQK